MVADLPARMMLLSSANNSAPSSRRCVTQLSTLTAHRIIGSSPILMIRIRRVSWSTSSRLHRPQRFTRSTSSVPLMSYWEP